MTFIAIYVDDILLTDNDPQEITTLKYYLHSVFSIKDLGKLNYFLGIEVSYTSTNVILHQNKFTKELLSDSCFDTFKRVVTPLPTNLKLSAHEGKLLDNPTLYRGVVGKLNFLTHTRPDLSYAVQALSQFMQTPRDSHWRALKHTLNYVYNTCGQGILMDGSDKLTLQAYSDSD